MPILPTPTGFAWGWAIYPSNGPFWRENDHEPSDSGNRRWFPLKCPWVFSRFGWFSPWIAEPKVPKKKMRWNGDPNFPSRPRSPQSCSWPSLAIRRLLHPSQPCLDSSHEFMQSEIWYPCYHQMISWCTHFIYSYTEQWDITTQKKYTPFTCTV